MLVNKSSQHRLQIGIVAALTLYDLGEELFGQQPQILGKEGKEQAHQEVGQLLGRVAFAGELLVLLHGVGDGQEGIGRGFGDLLLVFVRRELFRVEEGPVQLFHARPSQNIIQGDGVSLARVVVEVGVDVDGVDVAGDEQGRVRQRFAVELKLLVGFVQVFVRPFVLPNKVVAEVDVGKAFLAAWLCRCGLQRRRYGLADHIAVAAGVRRGRRCR